MKSKDQTLLEEAYVKINEASKPILNIDPKLEKAYFVNFKKWEKGRITPAQWADICTWILMEIMKPRAEQKKEDKDYFEYWKKRDEEADSVPPIAP